MLQDAEEGGAAVGGAVWRSGGGARPYPASVIDFRAEWGGHDLAEAIDALDGGLQLARPVLGGCW